MWDLWQFWLEIHDKPLRWGTLLALLLFLADKFGRKLVISELKRLFGVGHKNEFSEYIANQKRIEAKIDALNAHMGVPPCYPSEIGTNGLTSLKGPLPLSSAVTHLGNQYERMRRRMQNQINWFTLSVSILGALKMILQVNGIDVITDDHINAIANGIAAIAAIVGVFLSHRKPAIKEATTNADSTQRPSLDPTE